MVRKTSLSNMHMMPTVEQFEGQANSEDAQLRVCNNFIQRN